MLMGDKPMLHNGNKSTALSKTKHQQQQEQCRRIMLRFADSVNWAKAQSEHLNGQ